MASLEIGEVKERVMEVIKRNAVFNADKVNENSSIRRDHGIDSIKLVEMIIDLEEEFDIEVDSAVLNFENFATVKLISNYVAERL